jgi:vitamin B12 transporter
MATTANQFLFNSLFYLVILAFLRPVNNLHAQTITDSVLLSEVQISAKSIVKFQAGSKIETVSPKTLELFQDGNLSDMLKRLSPISIKTTAGGLATIRIRGSSPDHTTINFGGINVNSVTLGHSNISNLPLYLFDELGLQYGSSATVNGSGNIGGAIHLMLGQNWTDGIRAECRISHGSYGEQMYGSKIFAGNGKLETVSRFYYFSKTNNFKFFNTSIKDFSTGKIGVDDIQRNANIVNKGFLQEFNYRFQPEEYIRLAVWMENDWHKIQQNQAANYLNPEYFETYEDKHIRAIASYDNRTKPFKFHGGLGYVSDNAVFNRGTNQIMANRFMADFFTEHDLSDNISYKTGIKFERVQPTVYAYGKNIGNEDRLDVFFLYNHHFFKKLRITLNLRHGFVTGYNIPFVPSLGFSWNVYHDKNNSFKVSGNIGKSYRIPSFNDRFWLPGGNRNLLPENGFSSELSAAHKYLANRLELNHKIHFFYMDITNWVLWSNGGSFWFAGNVQQVRSKGIEAQSEIIYKISGFNLSQTINYSLTKAERVKTLNSQDALGRQLEYVPMHSATSAFQINYKSYDFSLDASYTHWQFTDETFDNLLDACFLLNASVSALFKVNKNNRFKLNFLVNNLLNKNYQSSLNYAMPRIHYRISLTYYLKYENYENVNL